jgi:hypothetical protein
VNFSEKICYAIPRNLTQFKFDTIIENVKRKEAFHAKYCATYVTYIKPFENLVVPLRASIAGFFAPTKKTEQYARMLNQHITDIDKKRLKRKLLIHSKSDNCLFSRVPSIMTARSVEHPHTAVDLGLNGSASIIPSIIKRI